jgi:hypothetical protein
MGGIGPDDSISGLVCCWKEEPNDWYRRLGWHLKTGSQRSYHKSCLESGKDVDQHQVVAFLAPVAAGHQYELTPRLKDAHFSA